MLRLPQVYVDNPEYVARCLATPQYLPGQFPGHPSPSLMGMGQFPGLSDKAVPFIGGMLVWAFFGETIKDLLGLSQHVARKGISAASSKVGAKK